MSSKSFLKLLILAVVMGVYALAISHIPHAKEFKPVNFGWLACIAVVAAYVGLRWVCGRIIKQLLVCHNTNLQHPLVVGAASGLGALLAIPAAAFATVAVPGVTFVHPEVGVMILLALSTYFFVIDAAWAYLEDHYKNNNG